MRYLGVWTQTKTKKKLALTQFTTAYDTNVKHKTRDTYSTTLFKKTYGCPVLIFTNFPEPKKFTDQQVPRLALWYVL